MIPPRRRALWTFGGLLLAGLTLTAVGVWLWWLYHAHAAETALQEFRLDRARRHLERCLQVWPYGAATPLLAAQTARRLEELDEAEQRLTEVERRHGHSPATRLERALLRAQRGDVDHVKANLYALITREEPGTDLALEALAHGHLLNSRSDLALQALDKLLGRHPDHLPALLLRGSIWEDLGKTKEAIHDYERVVALNPEASDPRRRLADLLSGLGRVREAIIHYQWLRQIQPRDARVVVGLCRCLADQQEWDEARRLLDELLASQPDNVPALVERGRLELRRGKADAALPLLRQATRQAAHDREAFWVLHLCLEMLDQQEEDRRCLDEVARIDGDRQRLSHLLSRIQEDGQDLSSRYEAGTLLLRTGREAEGVRMLSAILEQDPRHRPARTALAEYYQRQPN